MSLRRSPLRPVLAACAGLAAFPRAAAAALAEPDLAGGALGGLFSSGNDHFVGPGILDLLLLGLVVYLGYRFIRSRRNPDKDPRRQSAERQNSSDTSQPPDAGQTPDEESHGRPAPGQHPHWRRPADRYEAARQMWERMGAGAEGGQASEPSGHAAPASSGLDQDELLRGVKVVYVRIQNAMDRKNLDDVQDFTSDTALEQMRERMQQRPDDASTDVLLVNAKVLNVDDSPERTRVRVEIEALIRESEEQAESEKVREVWRFSRAGPRANWMLEAMEQQPADAASSEASGQ